MIMMMKENLVTARDEVTALWMAQDGFIWLLVVPFTYLMKFQRNLMPSL
jgi:hypothetical protein